MAELFTVSLALFLIWLFGSAAVHKFRSPFYYQKLLSSYFTTAEFSRLTVYTLGAIELLVALLLISPQTRELGLLAGIIILSLYALMMLIQIKRGRDDLACGCAGPASSLTVSPALVVRNLLCAALAVLAVTSSGSGLLGFSGYGLAAGIAAFVVILYMCSDQLIANAQLMAGDL